MSKLRILIDTAGCVIMSTYCHPVICRERPPPSPGRAKYDGEQNCCLLLPCWSFSRPQDNITQPADLWFAPLPRPPRPLQSQNHLLSSPANKTHKLIDACYTIV